jgi:hypothetical protein
MPGEKFREDGFAKKSWGLGCRQKKNSPTGAEPAGHCAYLAMCGPFVLFKFGTDSFSTASKSG